MRKHPIVAFHLSLIVGVALFGVGRSSQAQSDSELPQAVYLYEGDAPGSEGMSDIPKQVRPGSDRVVTSVHRPLLYPYLPAEGTESGMAVIVAPGGGHNSLWSTHEGHTPAKYFAEHGIAAFVLEYRLAEEKDSKYTVDEHALGDLHRAIRLIRARAKDWQIDPRRIGVMGFSAGGEIAALSGMRFDAGDENAKDSIAKQSSRPDFVALIYPGRSHRFEPKKDSPPTFIAAGFGDRRDIAEGMAEVYLKYKRAGVPTELHIYSNAGHGFGLREGKSGSVMKWVDRFIDWAGDRKLLPAEPMAGVGNRVRNKEVIIEEGGTGPYSAIATEDASLPGMTIFRPRDLSPFGDNQIQKLPILLWGNGACANTTQEHKNFLNEIASHGYVVLGIGLLDQIEKRDETSRQKTQTSQLLSALDWIIVESGRAESLFSGKVDTTKVAAMGMSCGGLQAIEISPDPRISTTVVCNSGVLPNPSPLPGMPALKKEILEKLHAPVLYIMGGPSDIAYNNAMDDFSRVSHVPIVMTNLDVGHGGTYGRPHGGKFTPVALAWLDWQLKGESENSKMFLGSNSMLAKDPDWSVEAKNFKSQE
ncbi:alpha/beta hydrolase fold domain-containing protein [Stieleria varia]|uniref:Acetylxylan esterase n=1 Tax=Stieleria varia TaxID=2528005 RepID=A0A5C6AZ22_9BACT|nr:alpha/beta hydrolase fold domain-containing protein [Stieleria varia]TWU04930.1 Acetylxylan esterase precursor [Stieleria varia]